MTIKSAPLEKCFNLFQLSANGAKVVSHRLNVCKIIKFESQCVDAYYKKRVQFMYFIIYYVRLAARTPRSVIVL